MLNLLPTTLRFLLGSLLWLDVPQPPAVQQAHSSLSFQLRHQHAITNDSRVIFSNTIPSFAADPYTVSTSNVQTHRPQSAKAFHGARLRSIRHDQSEHVLWDTNDVLGPNIEDREALLTLAKMTSNAYTTSTASDWYTLEGWNNSTPFGWEPDADGLRGHVFVSDDNSTVVLSIKGTSAGWITGGGGPTVRKDKLNDNLLFSCCCARVGPTWSTVCNCYQGSRRCDQECLEKSLIGESLYYSVGVNLYNNITYMYPKANIWLTGHSLGGSLASLIGVTFGAPVVAFEAPSEKLAATRLHLPSPPSTQHVTHVFHTADPIPMGVCTGVTSSCGIAGYAMETQCHLGKVIRYDTVAHLGWSVDVRTHSIVQIIDRLLGEDWTQEEGRTVPEAKADEDCVDCYDWEFGSFKG
ncbi:Alpha/Beta hydrolase protein [Suillus paluster]|uniref:Alpha/Beta hydrolase protein n=1 Tax=Suillus paluster TaxID=48578 RepID=UPI001B880B80|nr:Alpha/Beta hydrolase protein [Suillus paluster]KAG1731183.1 Alpha/Beta hydrolase protein [Suillus paluster]